MTTRRTLAFRKLNQDDILSARAISPRSIPKAGRTVKVVGRAFKVERPFVASRQQAVKLANALRAVGMPAFVVKRKLTSSFSNKLKLKGDDIYSIVLDKAALKLRDAQFKERQRRKTTFKRSRRRL